MKKFWVLFFWLRYIGIAGCIGFSLPIIIYRAQQGSLLPLRLGPEWNLSFLSFFVTVCAAAVFIMIDEPKK